MIAVVVVVVLWKNDIVHIESNALESDVNDIVGSEFT